MATSAPKRAIQVAVSLVPWMLALYLFYWLDTSGTWTAETAHRGKLSVVIMASGMAISFVLWNWLERRHRS